MREFKFLVDPTIFDRPSNYTDEESTSLRTLGTCIENLKEKGLESSAECLVQFQVTIRSEAWVKYYPNALDVLSKEETSTIAEYFQGQIGEHELPLDVRDTLEKMRSRFFCGRSGEI